MRILIDGNSHKWPAKPRVGIARRELCATGGVQFGAVVERVTVTKP